MSRSNFDRMNQVRDAPLPAMVKLLLFVLVTHADKDTGICWPAIATIRVEMGVKSRRTVIDTIESAESLKVLRVVRSRGHSKGKRSRSDLTHKYHIQDDKLEELVAQNDPMESAIDPMGSPGNPNGVIPCTRGDQSLEQRGSAIDPEPLREPTREQTKEPPRGSPTNHHERKRNPKTSQLPSLPIALAHGELPSQWDKWVRYRAQSKHPLTPLACEIQFKDFIRWGIEKSCIAIDNAISSGWRAPYEPRSFSSGSPHQASSSPGITDAEMNAILAQAPSSNRSRS